MKSGYARVSTDDQTLDLQLDALKSAGCEQIFPDTASGAKDDRPGLRDALAYVRAGDTLMVWRLDRLGRSLTSLIELMTSSTRAVPGSPVLRSRSTPPHQAAS